MKTRLIACVLLLVSVVAYGQEPRDPQPEKKLAPRRASSRSSTAPWRQKWEYSVVNANEIKKQADGDLQAGLNKLGEDGWELVAVRVIPAERGRGSEDYYFKRATTPAMTGMMGGAGIASFGGPGGPDRGGPDRGGFDRGGFDRGGFGGGFGTSTGTRTESGPRGPSPTTTPRAAATEKQNFQVIVLKHAAATDLGGTLQTLFAHTSARIVPEPQSNSLIVAGSEEQTRAIRELVAQLDQPRREQKLK